MWGLKYTPGLYFRGEINMNFDMIIDLWGMSLLTIIVIVFLVVIIKTFWGRK